MTVSNGDTAGTGNTVDRANLLLSDPYLSGQGPLNYLNPAAFGIPTTATTTTAGAYGTLGRNSLRTDPYHNLDMSLTRLFPIKDRTSIQFRADAFNVSNSVVLGQPNSTLGNSNFGVITGTQNTQREIQFSMKLLF